MPGTLIPVPRYTDPYLWWVKLSCGHERRWFRQHYPMGALGHCDSCCQQACLEARALPARIKVGSFCGSAGGIHEIREVVEVRLYRTST
jgi:hypothetical protein